MAPSPNQTIPTSFVPKQPVKSAARFSRSGGNMLLIFSSFVLACSLVAAGAAFGYEEFLKSVERNKAASLARAEASVDPDQVEDFVRARDRFAEAEGILDRHIALSNFFDLLERITLINVRFSSFSFTASPEGALDITLSGNARSFNALAAQSAAFSGERDMKRAIFSGISLDDEGTVAFDVSATLDPDLIRFEVLAPVVPEVEVVPEVLEEPAETASSTETSASGTPPTI